MIKKVKKFEEMSMLDSLTYMETIKKQNFIKHSQKEACSS